MVADLGQPLPIEDASVDVVLSLAVIEHLGVYLVNPTYAVRQEMLAHLLADGACALVVTSLDRARDLKRPPAVIAASALLASGSGNASPTALPFFFKAQATLAAAWITAR